MGNENTKGNQLLTPAGISSMDEALQKKFSKGVQYNMKIVIRGDRNTGKTNLYRRMEGKHFDEAYTPTSAINVTSILWSYKVTSDTVKVEVWDVVDKGKPQKKGSVPLKLANETAEDEDGLSLDADFLDVYKNANGVVFVYDITKLWTWQYIERELPRVPMHIPIIILGNFRDMEKHRVINQDAAMSFIEHLDRPEGAALVRYAEGSMKDAFGLMHLYKFLSIPFLHLQQEALLQQLRSNREQILAANEELEAASKAEDQNYELYKETISKKAMAEKEKKRKEKEDMEAQVSVPAEKEKKRKERNGVEKPEAEHQGRNTEAPKGTEAAAVKQAKGSPEPISPSTEDSERLVESVPDAAEKQAKEKGTTATTSAPATTSLKAKLSSRFAGFMSKSKQTVPTPALPKSKKAASASGGEEAVAEFVPEGDGVQTFLGEEERRDEDKQASGGEEEDGEGGPVNPLVAQDEDLSSLEGQEAVLPKPVIKEEKPSALKDVSSDEDSTKKVVGKDKKSSLVQPDEDLSSDEDSTKKVVGKDKKSSLVQPDEDLSSDEDSTKKVVGKDKKSSLVQPDEDLSSDEDSTKKVVGKDKKSSLVQPDEDLSSDEDSTKKVIGKKSSLVQPDEDLSSDDGGKKKLVVTADKDISDDEGQKPAAVTRMAPPLQAAPPLKSTSSSKAAPPLKVGSSSKAPPAPKVQLKSAKEIVLTESEEEEEPVEDATMVTKPLAVKGVSQGFMMFDQSDITKPSLAAAGGQKGKGAGLLLGWKEPKQQPQSSPEMPEKNAPMSALANGSPVTPSKKEKKSKHHKDDSEVKEKKSSTKKEHHKDKAKKSDKSMEDGEKASKKKDGNGVKHETVDPFAPLSLDAWLDGDDDTKEADRTDGDDGKSKPKKKKHKSDTGKKSKRKASDGGEDYATL